MDTVCINLFIENYKKKRFSSRVIVGKNARKTAIKEGILPAHFRTLNK